jgi:hypothetical protein
MNQKESQVRDNRPKEIQAFSLEEFGSGKGPLGWIWLNLDIPWIANYRTETIR